MKMGKQSPVAHSHHTSTAQERSRSHCPWQRAWTPGGKTPNPALDNRLWVLRTSALFCCYGYFLCGKERITGLFLYCPFLHSEPGRKGAHAQMWNKLKALSSGNTHNMTLFVSSPFTPLYTEIAPYELESNWKLEHSFFHVKAADVLPNVQLNYLHLKC